MVTPVVSVEKRSHTDDYNRTPNSSIPNSLLAIAMTRSASKQSYYTIRLLADKERTASAYRAYAYFRWVDDMLDERLSTSGERLAFMERQHWLFECACQGDLSPFSVPEEYMLAELVRSDERPDSGLQIYIRHMLAVMAFDAERRGRLISQQELDSYTLHLATAVTEALHYYIGHDQFAPHDETRYLAVSAAHITHMLRDTAEDIAAGYYNIPHEFLQTHGIHPDDMQSIIASNWVRQQVQLARDYFLTGKSHLARIENSRCRLAGYAYIARFEWVLDTIEREGYQLHSDYSERKSMRAAMSMAWSVLRNMFNSTPQSSTGLGIGKRDLATIR